MVITLPTRRLPVPPRAEGGPTEPVPPAEDDLADPMIVDRVAAWREIGHGGDRPDAGERRPDSGDDERP